jgi:transposase InsO family protein
LASGLPGSTARRYTPQAKRALVEEFAVASAVGELMAAFCARRGISTASLCKWRKRLRVLGDAGLEPRPNPRNRRGPHRGQFSYTPEQRRAAVEAFLAAGQPIQDFVRIWGVSRMVFSRWVKRYREGGPKALEPTRRARSSPSTPGSGVGVRLAQPLRNLIARTRDRFAQFGLRKIRDYLLRFHGVKVSTGGVKSALIAEGRVASQPKPRKIRRSPPAVRSFERARPMQLWQTDITSFLIGPHKERVYLTVFLDDMSRFVVSFALHLQQKSELVIEALKDGMARFGKPQEILSDQGRQYFAWRGKSEFQKLLKREVIAHVVARSHHPQTVGKCERLWETVKREFLDRVALKDLADARTRLAHYFAHYNFFRPHQGINGLVPADRFFGAQEALRQTLEAQITKQELALALQEAPRAPVFLFGQIGEEQVSLHGERGRLVIQTEAGNRRELLLDDLGASALQGASPTPPAPPAERSTSESVPQGEHDRVQDAENQPPIDATDDRVRDAESPIAESGAGAAAATGSGERAGRRDPLRGELGEPGEPGEPTEPTERDGGGSDDDERVDAVGGSASEAAPPRREAGQVSTPAAAAAAGEIAVDGGERGGEAAGAQGLLGDAGVLAREDREGGGGGAAVRERAAGVAAEPTGARGDGGGALEAAADAGAADPNSGCGGGPGHAQAPDCAPAAGALLGDAPRGTPEGTAGASGECHAAPSEGARGDAAAGGEERPDGDAQPEGGAWPTRASSGGGS